MKPLNAVGVPLGAAVGHADASTGPVYADPFRRCAGCGRLFVRSDLGVGWFCRECAEEGVPE